MLEQPAFGRRLKALRLERGLTQAAVAEGGVSTGYLSRLESGARPPTARAVEFLAARLGVPVAAFEATSEPHSLAQIIAAVSSAPEEDRHPEALADVLAEALRAEPGADVALRWQGLWLLARLRSAEGRYEQERMLLEELVELNDRMGVAELSVRTRARLSRCAQTLGDNAAARAHALAAYQRAEGLGVADQVAVLQVLVSAEAEAGRLAEARGHADQWCALAEPLGGAAWVRALWASATVAIRQADYAAARDALENALRRADPREDLVLWLRLRLAAASLYLQVSPAATEQARAMLDEVAPVTELTGTELHRQQLVTLRAHLAFEEGRIEDARTLCARIDEAGLRLSFRDRVRFQALRGQLAILRGDVEEGTRTLNELAEQAQQALNVELAAEVWRGLARALADAYGSDDHDAASRPRAGTSR
ncbi:MULTISPECIES: helix-turn-helix transcriptional regulator [Actinomadura]|uniref:Helix-turn-helix domain-containing protein n=1 Tax=Actinomadura litoris TaxID=2678616 RepID=A0A7K1KXL7_9ACTN|nr:MULTISPECIES: helix-turn-helix transcriptional regulator [Actinomadura]MUN36807.1 helix-turn-helix domain-containing protein [Actinomadura litoris]